MGQNKPLFLLVRALPRPSDPFSLTSVASLPSGEGLSIDKHASKRIPTPHPRSNRVAGPWKTVEQAWLRRLLRGRVHLVPSPGLPPEPQPRLWPPRLFSTSILHRTMVCVPAAPIIIWNLDVSCSALLISWRDWTMPSRDTWSSRPICVCVCGVSLSPLSALPCGLSEWPDSCLIYS